MFKYKRFILVPVGDKQAGHNGALVNPEASIPDVELDRSTMTRIIMGYRHPELSSLQKDMWKWHEKDREEIGKLAGKDSIIYIGMGDETQGGIFKDDLKDVSLSAQYFISYYNMLPWLNMKQMKGAYFAKGTAVHLWGDGDTETILTHRLNNEFKHIPVKMSPHWELNFDGFRVDVAHHGPGVGMREWTKGNTLRLYTKSLQDYLHNNGKPIPDLLLRAHFHQPICEVVTKNLDTERFRTDAWITPPQCFIGGHGQKVTQSVSMMHIGMLAFEIVNNRILETHEFMHSIDLRVEERINL